MKTVKEVSRLTGVSVRALHHYDAIGLLTPSRVTEAGYRLYDDASLRRLHTILLFRELQFPLGEIRKILYTPDFDPAQALQQQIELLILKQKRLEGLIRYARQIQKTGVIDMDFTPFDTTEMDRCAAEAKAKWGRDRGLQGICGKDPGPDEGSAENRRRGPHGHLCIIRNHQNRVSRISGGPGPGRAAPGPHHRPLLHLHRRNPERPGADVRGGRRHDGKH